MKHSSINDKKYSVCNCPVRVLPPSVPTEIPFEPIPSNIPLLEKWIIERYASSCFNKCENQPLPLMKGSPPLVLHVDDEVKPTVVSKPAIIPAHWSDQVKR